MDGPGRLDPRRRVSALLLVSTAALVACESDAAPVPAEQRPQLRVSKKPELPAGVDPVSATDLLQLAKRPGSRGLVVNVWASWCGSCRDEVPMLLGLRDSLADTGLSLQLVAADEPASLPKALELLQGWEVPLPAAAIAPGTLNDFKHAMSPDWHGGIPATFLLDAEGKLRHFWEGPILEEEIAPIVQRFLAGEIVDGVTRTAAEPG